MTSKVFSKAFKKSSNTPTPKDLLICWNQLEYFTPFELDSKKAAYRILSQDMPLPWEEVELSLDKDKKVEHTVYLAAFKYREVDGFVKDFFQQTNVPENISDKPIVSASMKIDQKGQYIYNSFSLSTFPFGLSQIKNQKLQKQGWNEAFETVFNEIKSDCDYLFNKLEVTDEKEFIGINKKIDREDIERVTQSIRKQLEWTSNVKMGTYYLTKKVPIKSKEWSPYEKGIVPTLFSQDLEKVIQDVENNGLTKALESYLDGGLNGENIKKSRIDLDIDQQELKNSMNVSYYPDGCWPSKFKLSLMQQFSVNQVLKRFSDSKKGMYAVNGPPGTGKTTLIRDVIAANIVEKAKVQVTFDQPLNAFNEEDTIITNSGFKHYVYSVAPKLNQFHTLIASSNNGAVENISKELPLKKEVEPYQNDLKYFREVAAHCLDENYWGLISAVLGKQENRNKFYNSIQVNKDFSLKAYFEKNKETSLDTWDDVRGRFQNKLSQVEQEKERIEHSIKSDDSGLREELGNSYADSLFWDNIHTYAAQVACPWYTDQLKKLQSELFTLALEVNECFLLSAVSNTPSRSSIVYNTLRAFFDYQDGSLTLDSKQKQMLWKMFFQVIPVVSTTFAAFGYMLRDFDRESLPWLIIDEAGQAMPQIAAGAIWRSKQVLVVGDPMQIEPVNTIPNDIVESVGKIYNLNREQLGAEISVQSYADRVNEHGKYLRIEGGDKVWIGTPLKVHRRCDDPMFKISNAMVYNQSMVNATDIKFTKLKMKTTFIHCEGSVSGKHFVDKQGDEVFRIVSQEFENNKEIPNLFIISPFSEVVDGVKEKLGKAQLHRFGHDSRKVSWWINTCIGTVHTFQGKQADGVILCLGLDKTTIGAAKWASQKPNLLNVALTRAKYRFVAIGDKDVWLSQPYYKKLADLEGNSNYDASEKSHKGY